MFEGAILGIDHGTKFIGVALSHSGEFAKPLSVIARKSKQADFEKLSLLIRQYEVQQIVLGLPPVPPDFVGHSQADTVRNWAKHLAEALQIPIYFWDEGMSSVDAETALRAVDKHLERVDAQAAALILQDCLDAIREGRGTPHRFEDNR